MRFSGFYFAVALTFLVVAWLGWATNKPQPRSDRPASTDRGQPPAGGLARTLSVDPAQGVGGGYPLRAFAIAILRKPPSDSGRFDADSDRARNRRGEAARSAPIMSTV